MTHYEIPPAKEIPFFDHGKNLAETIQRSSSRRNMSPLKFMWRKVRNILLNRMAYFCPLNAWRIRMHRWRGVHIGQDCYIAQQVNIDNAYPEYVFIEDHCGVNQGVTILTHTNVRSDFGNAVRCRVAPVVLRQDSLVSINCTLLPGVEIGEHAIVSAGSVVLNRVKPYTLVIGNPAKKYADLHNAIQ
ncbi:MAG: acyltransferase [Bacteroidales bacterium]|nr:acyltransferase [Bacteroidales bacterium]